MSDIVSNPLKRFSVVLPSQVLINLTDCREGRMLDPLFRIGTAKLQ